jgi:ectoine hydroxylase-related dioxygenase (phytanoyl-CoA dioxygenase family)
MLTVSRQLPGSLTSNGYIVENTPDKLGWLTPTDPATPMRILREQYDAQGYLWLKGILNRDAVLAFRRFYFSAYLETGMIAPGTDPVDGIYSGGEVDQQAVRKVLFDFVKCPEFENFCRMEPIVEFYREFFQNDIYLHKRKIIRHKQPGHWRCTGGHYDLIYLRAGTDRLASSWIPIGDIPVEMGGLIYLEGSEGLGRKFEADFTTAGYNLTPEQRISAYNDNMKGAYLSEDLPDLARRINGRWLAADYEAGDMVVHNPYMIHASTVNNDPQGRFRLSTDIRYQSVSDEVDRRWTNHWVPDDQL